MANFFPRWANLLPLKIAFCLIVISVGVSLAFAYFDTPKTTRQGYQPDQPIPYSHKIHVEQLGLDCRYCHSFVEYSGQANLPAASVCWSCHQHVQRYSPKLEPLRRAMDESYEHFDGKPIAWVKVHKAPDYVYFNHSVHVNRGISCQSCHGQVNEMEVVFHAESHSMSWCLDCHRHPEKFLRPNEEVFNMKYDSAKFLKIHEVSDEKGCRITDPAKFGRFLKKNWSIQPKESCAECHR